jgi:hypothetical protein
MIGEYLVWRVLSLFFGMCVFAMSNAVAQVGVLTQHNDNARTGTNLRELVLTPANVNKGTEPSPERGESVTYTVLAVAMMG